MTNVQRVDEIFGEQFTLLSGLFPPPGYELSLGWLRDEKLPRGDTVKFAVLDIRWLPVSRYKQPRQEKWLSVDFPVLREEIELMSVDERSAWLARRLEAASISLMDQYEQVLEKKRLRELATT